MCWTLSGTIASRILLLLNFCAILSIKYCFTSRKTIEVI
uniref:Uncharacterized protein n=1 Tax=Anguilla anguilla TaxID=7936 RepID=A0A0E9XXU5_ANGAN